MKLTLEGISDRKEWEQKGYKLPEYNIEKMRENTKSKPFWIHFGAGNLFRAFHARVVQNMLNVGAIDRGLVVAEGFDYEIIKKMYEPHDNLGLVATLKSDGSIDKDVVASVAEALPLDSADEKAYNRLKEIFANDSLQMATFTITEKGYSLVNAKGETMADVAADFEAGPDKPSSYMGKVASLLYNRYVNGAKMIEIIGYKEGLPVVVNPGILDPKKFIKTVLEVRLPNPFMPDTPQRIATDTSQKLAIRFGETIKAYMASDELEASDLKLIPLVFAGWLRYLMAVDDNGNAFEPSSDPMLAELTPYLKDIKWNDEQAEKKILPILAKSEIFGVNLAEAGLLCRVVKYFKELIAGVGAVRTTLHKYVSNN